MNLRDIVRNDLETLRQHRNSHETRVFLQNAKIVSARDQDKWFGSLKLRPRDSFYQIAEDNGIDIGIVRVTHFKPGLHRDGIAHVGCEVFLDHRKKGWGHKLFHAAIDLAIYKHASFLYTSLFEDNRAAVHVAEKAGFTYDTEEKVIWLMCKLPGMTDPAPCAYVQMVKR